MWIFKWKGSVNLELVVLNQQRLSSLSSSISDPSYEVTYPVPITVEEEPTSDQMFPRKSLIENQTFISELINLLNHPSSLVNENAWYLLELLPMNRNLFSSLIEYSEANKKCSPSKPLGTLDCSGLNSILDSNISLLLLYKLSVLSSLLFPSAKLPSSRLANITTTTSTSSTLSSSDIVSSNDSLLMWSDMFLKSGGVAHLITLLTSQQNIHRNNKINDLFIRCYSLLFKIIKSYLVHPKRLECFNSFISQKESQLVNESLDIDKSTLTTLLSHTTNIQVIYKLDLY